MKRKFHQQPSVKESQTKKQKIMHESGSFINKQQQREKQVSDKIKGQPSTGAGGSSNNGKFPIKHSKQTCHIDKSNKVITQNEKVQSKKYKKKNIDKLKKEHFKRKTQKYTKKRQEHKSNGDTCNKESVCDIDSTVKSSIQDVKTLKHSKSQSSQKSMKEQSEKAPEAMTNKQTKLPASSNEFSSNWKQFCLAEGISSKKKHKHSKMSSSDENGKSKSQENKSPEIWFDDVDEILLEHESEKNTELKSDSKQQNSLVKLGSYSGCTKVVAMDCEMVGVGDHGSDNMLARVSIVNQYGNCVYDTFVKPVEQVVDYRTHVSGVRKSDLETGKDFKLAQKEVADILKGRILVGHALHNDLQVLYLSHPKKNIRDTSRFKPFRQLFSGRNPSLKKLSAKVLHVNVQEGEHSSVQDAQATMRLYTMYKKQWEKDIKLKSHRSKGKQKHVGKTKIDNNLSTALLEDSD